MQTIRRVLAILTLLIAGVFGVQRPEATAQESACDDPLLIAFSADAQYNAACDAFMACIEYFDDFELCTMHFYAERVVACAADDDICVAQARLHTALISFTVGNGYVDHGQPDEFWVDLAARIADRSIFEAAEFEEVLEWYAPLYDAYSGEHPMWFYSNGVLQLLKGDLQSGLSLIEEAMSRDSGDPFIHFTRGDIHAARGENELAALHYFITTAIVGAPYLSENLTTVMTEQTNIYPYSYSTESYLLYPIIEMHEGPGGRSLSDMTLQAPREIALQRYGDLLLFIPKDLDTQREEVPSRILLPFYVLELSNDTYLWRGQDYDTGNTSRLTLIETEDGFEGEWVDIVFEGTSTTQFIVVPEGSEDPRVVGFRCEDTPLTRLEGAVFATPLRWWEPVQLYDEPSGTATEIEQDSQMLIVLEGELECLDGYMWWPVKVVIDSKEQTGWIQENADSTNYLYDRIDYD